jgi:hypothetical protein
MIVSVVVSHFDRPRTVTHRPSIVTHSAYNESLASVCPSGCKPPYLVGLSILYCVTVGLAIV